MLCIVHLPKMDGIGTQLIFDDRLIYVLLIVKYPYVFQQLTKDSFTFHIPDKHRNISSKMEGLKISQDVEAELHVDEDIKQEWER